MFKITLSNGKKFDCMPGQSILEAAQVNGIVLEYSCKTGRCGVCKSKIHSGSAKPTRDEISLSKEQEALGYVLTCCRTPESDLSLDIEDVPELENIHVKTLPCRIDSIFYLNQDVLEISLRTPPASLLKYLPGQYISIIGKNGVRRSYSIANAPRDDGKLTLQVRKVINGEMSRYWFEEARLNDLLRFEGPLGTFFLRNTRVTQLVLLATGTGIAPIRAILDRLAADPSAYAFREIRLYWGGRTEEDFYWSPNYPSLPLRFEKVLSRSQDNLIAKRYVQDAVLADDIAIVDSVVYACGSEAMISGARFKLVAAGLDPKNFYSDAFVSSE